MEQNLTLHLDLSVHVDTSDWDPRHPATQAWLVRSLAESLDFDIDPSDRLVHAMVKGVTSISLGELELTGYTQEKEDDNE